MSMSSLPSKLPVTAKPSSTKSAPIDAPKQEGLVRTSSQRSQVDDPGRPKALAHSNSNRSVGRRSSEATDKLASMHPQKPASAAKAKSTEGPADLYTEGRVASAKAQLSEVFSEALKKDDAGFTAALQEHLDKGGTPEEFGRKAFTEALKELSSEHAQPVGSLPADTHVSPQPSVHGHDGGHAPSIHEPSVHEPSVHDALSLHDHAEATPPGDSKGWLATANDFLLRVGRNNDFKSTGAKIAASVANVTARNTLSVFLPTFARQFISMGIEAGFQHFETSDRAKALWGLGFGLVPALASHFAGAIRDEITHYHRTPEEKAQVDMWTSRRARMWMAGTATAATIWEHKAGAAADNASLHMAFTIYTAMRDLLVQSNIRLDNRNTEGQSPDWKHFLTMSIAYGLDQGLVSLGMSTLASPSGPAAAKANLSGIEQAKNAAIRAGLNLLGEIGEDLLFQSIPAIRSLWNDPQTAHALELGIHTEGPTRYLANATMGPWAVRTGILATTIALTGISGNGLPKLWDKNGEKLSDEEKAKRQELTADMIIAGVNGFLYEPFANSGANQPQPRRPIQAGDEESQLGADDALRDDTAAVTTYAHPNVDMTDAASVRRRSQQNLPLQERSPSRADA